MREYEYLKKLRTDTLENMRKLNLLCLENNPNDLVAKSLLKDIEDELKRRKPGRK